MYGGPIFWGDSDGFRDVDGCCEQTVIKSVKYGIEVGCLTGCNVLIVVRGHEYMVR